MIVIQVETGLTFISPLELASKDSFSILDELAVRYRYVYILIYYNF